MRGTETQEECVACVDPALVQQLGKYFKEKQNKIKGFINYRLNKDFLVSINKPNLGLVFVQQESSESYLAPNYEETQYSFEPGQGFQWRIGAQVGGAYSSVDSLKIPLRSSKGQSYRVNQSQVYFDGTIEQVVLPYYIIGDVSIVVQQQKYIMLGNETIQLSASTSMKVYSLRPKYQLQKLVNEYFENNKVRNDQKYDNVFIVSQFDLKQYTKMEQQNLRFDEQLEKFLIFKISDTQLFHLEFRENQQQRIWRIGSSDACDIVIKQKDISEVHAIIGIDEENNWYITQSYNNIQSLLVNSPDFEEQGFLLFQNMKIRIQDYEFLVKYDELLPQHLDAVGRKRSGSTVNLQPHSSSNNSIHLNYPAPESSIFPLPLIFFIFRCISIVPDFLIIFFFFLGGAAADSRVP